MRFELTTLWVLDQTELLIHSTTLGFLISLAFLGLSMTSFIESPLYPQGLSEAFTLWFTSSVKHMHMSSACPEGRPTGQPANYVGGIQGDRLDTLPLGRGKFTTLLEFLREEGGGTHWIYRKKGFIKGEVLCLLRANSVIENFEQRKQDLQWGYPLTLVQEILFEVKFIDRIEAPRNKTKQTKEILQLVTTYNSIYLQSGHTKCQKDSYETLGHHSTAT